MNNTFFRWSIRDTLLIQTKERIHNEKKQRSNG